jgi:hypothetical protein
MFVCQELREYEKLNRPNPEGKRSRGESVWFQEVISLYRVPDGDCTEFFEHGGGKIQ